MESLAPVWLLLRLALLVAGLLVPGAALLRALRLPRSIGGCFAGSAVVLYGSGLALNALGVRLSLASLATALAATTLAALLVAWRRGPTTPLDAGGEENFLAPFTRLGALAPAMLLYWGVIGFLLVREPLAGPDISFRWAFLPEQWLRLGTLDFYPPVSAADFQSYFWAESIPPGVASLYAWAFASGGGFAPEWTIPAVALQFFALHDLAWRAGAAAGGDRAARSAAVLAAACPLVNWSCRLGQESGLTTLAALGLVVTLLRWRATLRPAWVAAAGVFAVLGAMTREYGLVFPALAAAVLFAGRASRAAWGAFALAALPLALAWPLRCALHTGNPFYSLGVGGLLPVNPVFLVWIADRHAVFGAALLQLGSWLYLARWLVLGAAPAVTGCVLLLLAARRNRPAAFGAAAVAVLIGLWLLSIPYTDGGLFYSLRVASPALALGAVAAGVALARVRLPAVRTAVPAALLLATLPLTLLLPQNPAHVPLRDWPAPWRHQPFDPGAASRQIIPTLVAEHVTTILTDTPGLQTLLAPQRMLAVPFWSPQAAWLFDPALAPVAAAKRWRESGLRLVVLSKFPPALAFVNRHARWREPLFHLRRIGDTPNFMIFSVEAPAPSS